MNFYLITIYIGFIGLLSCSVHCQTSTTTSSSTTSSSTTSSSSTSSSSTTSSRTTSRSTTISTTSSSTIPTTTTTTSTTSRSTTTTITSTTSRSTTTTTSTSTTSRTSTTSTTSSTSTTRITTTTRTTTSMTSKTTSSSSTTTRPDLLYDRILIFDDNWNYQKFRILPKPAYLKEVDENIFISSSNSFFKTNTNVDVIRTYQQRGADYRGIFYEKSTELFFVASESLRRIDVFNKNLSLTKSIDMGEYVPYSINSYQKSELLIGTRFGEILTFNNNVGKIVKVYKTCRSYVTSIVLDIDGYMALTCYYPDNSMRLFHVNGTYTGVEKPTAKYPEFANFDSNGRLVVVANDQVDIFN